MALSEIFVKLLVDVIQKRITSHAPAVPPVAETIRSKIQHHLIEAQNWSSRIQFFGMSRGEETDASTIALKLHAEPRRFKLMHGAGDIQKSEADLLSEQRHYLVLGDPGAGKTTTLKRLVRRLLQEEPTENDIYQYPIVIRLREMRQPNITVAIADAIGIAYRIGARRLDDTEEESTQPTDAAVSVNLGRGRLERKRDARDYFVGDARLEIVVADALNETGAAVLLDGLDEVNINIRFDLQDDIVALARRLTSSKIIMSCRTGDYARVFEGFDLVEIKPLAKSQIREIAAFWLDEPEFFIDDLDTLPYRDVVDRPLLLVQLLFIYKRYGYLPDQPSLIYRKLVSTLLHEWDAERGIVRISAYSGFNAERKAEFLAALAYELTYRLRAKAFSEADLVDAYTTICDRFGLAKSEALDVVREVESHTGVITAGSAYTFEFSHLSLQEYFCADYLVRQPLSGRTWKYLREYPAPLAVATALSSHPSRWFATLVLTADAEVLAFAAQALCTRITIERPGFSHADELGVAVLRMLDVVPVRGQSAVLELLKLPNVGSSVAAALRFFSYDGRISEFEDKTLRLEALHLAVGGDELPMPRQGAIPLSLLLELVHQAYDNAVLLLQQLRAHPR